MNAKAVVSMILAALMLLSCASRESRIHGKQDVFDQYPPEVQQKIRAGEIEVDYTPEMVMMALGEPSRRYTRTTQTGTSEVWAWRDPAPNLGLSFGGIHFGGSSSVGAGVGISTGGYGNEEDKLSVVFVDGRVSSVERATK